ncbi:hypothetical protein prwr041_00650 [Prevotella herbatica]|uniref:Uncharacterized protein n=1 Tax=Prevotella herbatica TaxID=2801997 RepID=A0ABM7NUR0_9BACT|nr:hypothetical protein [Prevotella herbatica]BCS84172.1 hypothetical protein prwr041_00650 [Prevotella herbatica]
MRELTKNEKRLVTEIVTKCVPDSEVTIGDIIMSLYDINFMDQYLPNSFEDTYLAKEDYSSVCVQYKTYKGRNFQSEIYEAIVLLIFLKQEGFIFLNFNSIVDYYAKGKKHKIKASSDDEYEENRIYDVFPNTCLWVLFNSYCIVTNSLIDYSKDFKTEEQRRFRTSIRYTWIAILISLISCVITCFIGCK